MGDNLVAKRLDALIRLFIEMNLDRNEEEKSNETAATSILQSVCLTQTKIARILGEKTAQDVSQYLYPKKRG